MEPNPLEITVGDGKYTVIQTAEGKLICIGHVSGPVDQEARNALNEEDLVLCMAKELDSARAEIRFLKKDSEELLKRIDVLEAENGDQRRKIDELEDELARAREGDL